MLFYKSNIGVIRRIEYYESISDGKLICLFIVSGFYHTSYFSTSQEVYNIGYQTADVGLRGLGQGFL